MLATVAAATVLGVDGRPVTVEVHVGPGLPSFTIVGLPDAACREARDRVRAAVLSSGLTWPSNRRVTVNLAPTGLRKTGAGLDLAIAVGVLVASEQLPMGCTDDAGFLGELGLDGSVRKPPGFVPLVDAITRPAVVVPAAGGVEATLVERHEVRPVHTLGQLATALRGDEPWPPAPGPVGGDDDAPVADLADVRGQPEGRLALEIAAAGGHHVLFVGPPGAGKTMLASRLPGILPPLDPAAALEVTRIHSAAGLSLPAHGLVRRPPLRAPHHSATVVSVIGGGTAAMRPGEISCAHRGVLFLDELGEFPASVIDHLRQPLEEGVIRVSRARASVSYPARFLLVAAMNPCPCGAPEGPASCRCTDAARARYQRRVSGPVLDRFDLRVVLGRPRTDELMGRGEAEPSAAVAARVARARQLSATRGVVANAAIPAELLDALVPLRPDAAELLRRALESGRLSARGLHRVRRVARTIADLDGRDGPLLASDLAQALCLRSGLGPSLAEAA